MSTRLRNVLIGALLLAGAVLALAWYGAWRWDADSRALVARLERTARTAAGPGRFDPAALDSLPAPVARFLRLRARDHGRHPISARFQQDGHFRMGESEDTWRPFTAEQTFRLYPPGFVWDARIRMAPGVTVDVRDSYVDGEARTHAAVLGLIPVLDARGPEVAESALQRFLAEAMWFPERLRPGAGLSWKAIDDSTARATLEDSGHTVSLEFVFDDSSRIRAVRTDARLREVDGRFVPTPWDARVLDHTGSGQPVIEVAWTIDGARRPYWRGRVTGRSEVRATRPIAD